MKKSNKNLKGFTLIELVVVISIIGVLAAIIVPSILNYVHKACRASDKVTARLIGTTVMNLMAESPDFEDNFYNADTMLWTVTIDGETYKFRNVARADGSKNCYGSDHNENRNNHKQSGRGWEFTSSKDANVKVTDTLNTRLYDVIGGDVDNMSFIPMRSSGYKHPYKDCNHDKGYTNSNKRGNERNSSPTYSYTDKWIVGYNAGKDGKEKGQVEVWAGDSYGKGTNGPRVRLWPAPPSYY